MKNYQEMMAASKELRVETLANDVTRGGEIASERTVLQKHVSKVLVAMVKSGEIVAGELNKTAKELVKCDIRKTFQSVYELVNVFTAIIDKKIELTEDDFDKMDSSKLALLSPFLTKPELKDKLEDAVNIAKDEKGTAKKIRDLKPKADKDEDDKPETPKGVEIPIGFIATDIGKDEALVNSGQFKERLRADFGRAITAKDEDSLEKMLEMFGKAYVAACAALGADPLDYIVELTSAAATPAAGRTVETPALAAA